MTLKELRERSSLTREQVGRKLYVDRTCVAHWETGDWAPARKHYKRLAKMYGVTEEEIKGLADEIRAANKADV